MVSRSVWRPWKDEVVADGGAVASERPLTSEVGIDVLREGGNAVDAAVAMGFCAAVVEPQSSCVAGHGQMLVHMNGRTTALGLFAPSAEGGYAGYVPHTAPGGARQRAVRGGGPR